MEWSVEPKEAWEEMKIEGKSLVLLIGMPGAGKTSFVSWEVIGKGRLEIGALLNPDEMLFEEGEYRWSGKGVRRAWEDVQYRFLQRCKRGVPILLDATMGQKSARGWYLRKAISLGYRCIGIFFPQSLDLLLARNKERLPISKRMPEEKIVEFFQRLEEPEASEGFDLLFRVVGGSGPNE